MSEEDLYDAVAQWRRDHPERFRVTVQHLALALFIVGSLCFAVGNVLLLLKALQ